MRLAYAGTNDQPYKSVGRWLLDQGADRGMPPGPASSAWMAAKPAARERAAVEPTRATVFFREESARSAAGYGLRPPGCAGRGPDPGPVDCGRSRQSIPYGTPVWLASTGPQVQLNRLVLAQDTGSAILGAVRADYFTGWGQEAGDIAGRLKQGLRLWVLWPR